MRQDQMNRLSLAIVAWMGTLLILPVQAVYISISAQRVSAQPRTTQLSQEQLKQLAQSITVKIVSGDNGGSGILIKKQGQVYTVLTNQHVLDSGKLAHIQTPDGKTYPANLVSNVNFKGKDLALLQFRSNANYVVASLGNLSTVAVNEPIFSAGFPFKANPTESKGFVFRAGQVLLVSEQAFKEGYQIGYSNDVEKGMSGGPILNRQGKVIGINGIHAYPLWGNPYVYENGEQPTVAMRDLMSSYSWGIPIQTFAQLAPQYTSAEALPNPNSHSNQTLPPIANEVNNVAREITVQINVPNTPNCNGSGVIIAQQGNTYTILTAEHVVRETEKCDRRALEVVTYDGKSHQVKVNAGAVKTLPGVDLAVLQFSSNENYRKATLARHNLENKGGLVFVSGWPRSKLASRETSSLFTAGTLFNQQQGILQAKDSLSLTYGYGLVYTNITTSGVSGGPVLDVRGHVIGIHGRADGDVTIDEAGPGSTLQLGYSFGVPVSTFLSLVTKVGIKPEQLNTYTLKPPLLTNQEENSIVKALLKVEKPSDSSDAVVWLNYGNQLWRLSYYQKELSQEALFAFDRALQLKPGFYQAWYSRGQTLLHQQRYLEAIDAFDRAIRESNEKFDPAWRGRGEALINLHRNKEALVSFDRALALDSKNFIVHVWRGAVLDALERYEDALAAYNEAIKINAHPWAYNNRGLVRNKLGDRQAVTDFNKAIEIAPDYVNAYLFRGQVKYDWGDKQGALADYNKAIEINPYFAQAYFIRGQVRYYYEDRLGGIADLGKAIRINPKNAFFYYKWGGMYKNEGDDQEAIVYYNKAIEIDSNFAEVYYDRGLAHSKMGNQPTALADFKKAADLYQQQGKEYFAQQAQVRITELQRTALTSQPSKVASYEGAALNTTYQLPGKISIKIVKIDSSSRKVKVQVAFSQGLFGEGELDGVIDKDNVLELSGTIGTLEGGGFFKTSVSLEFLRNETIKGTYSLYSGDHNNRVRTQNGEFTASKLKGASEANFQANRLSPKNADAYREKGYAHYSQGDYTGAIANYTEAIRLKPNFAEAYASRGITRSEQGNHQRAIEDFNVALRLKPDWEIAYYGRGLTRAALKDYKGAIEDYTQMLRLQEFSGVGIQLQVNPQTKVLTVTKVIENSPAYKGGVKVGDQVLVIDNQPTANMSLEQAIKLIRGQIGTQVSLRFARTGTSAFNITFTRTPIAINTTIAEVFYNRGLARTQIRDNQKAREDFQKSAELYKQQGKIDDYQNALARIKKLQQ